MIIRILVYHFQVLGRCTAAGSTLTGFQILDVCIQIQHVQFLVTVTDGNADICIDNGLVPVGALGCDEHYTIGSLGAVNGRCRCILQDFDAGYILRIDTHETVGCFIGTSII